MAILIADSGSTKCEWCLVENGKKKKMVTSGISPYFLSGEQIKELLLKEVLPKTKRYLVEQVFYYGTGCKNPENRRIVKAAIRKVFPGAEVSVDHDLMGAARAVCRDDKGVACILGTGSSACYFNGKKIVSSRTGLGFVLGDEGSGAYLGKKVLQYYLYKTFDEDLDFRFSKTFNVTEADILENVYKQPLPNRYLASFTRFLAENRGHYMIENIIEDGLNDFFFHHICKFRESWSLPINFVGGVAYGFVDVLKQLCDTYEFEMGKVLKNPMDGLVDYHTA